MTLKYEPKYQEAKHDCETFLKSSFAQTTNGTGREYACAFRTDCLNHDRVKCVLFEKLLGAK